MNKLNFFSNHIWKKEKKKRKKKKNQPAKLKTCKGNLGKNKGMKKKKK